ncbi:MAG: T9SS type A sorting domain-containing protein [Bacteroidales bacterium]|nr:T9SS type A sorting domain-containing protein [Bacteroidales bacterium]
MYKEILITLILSILLFANTTNIVAQQGSNTSGNDASGAGGEFSYSIGQTDYRYYFSSQGSLQLGLQHGWPETREALQCANGIAENHVYSYESLCYNAVETLTIAGDGKQFFVEPGGHVDLVAGKSILLKEGTTIKPGGSLHAWITTDGSYCTDTISILVTCNLEIPSQIITENETLCFSAIETVVVAGAGKYFIVEPGAHVDIIAGQSILFKDGTTIEAGGSLHAWITTDETYCSDPEDLLAAAIEEEEIPVSQLEPEPNTTFFKVFPNPTTGDFTLELLDYNEFSTVTVEIFTIQGLLISNTQLPTGKLFNFSLAERQPGIYLIRVLRDKEVSIGKITKR